LSKCDIRQNQFLKSDQTLLSFVKTALFLTRMSLFITSLNSGSNGNCYYVGNEHDAILVDAGISCRETEKRMKRLELSLEKVRAIFVTHEHSDHIMGVRMLAKKYKFPIFITPRTRVNGRLNLAPNLVNTFTAYHPVSIGSLSITAFPTFHDAADPHNFIIRSGDVKVGVFTDIGVACPHVISQFSQCHAAFLEANYDEQMLEHGRYSPQLKRRIKGGKGHLSNLQALTLFKNYRAPFMSHLFLSHLSHDNNSPQIVEDIFAPIADQTRIIIATRYQETSVYHIQGGEEKQKPVALPEIKLNFQLRLF
jgi:phosphoribosyl 1,2-cyclic phosphodiesterase